MAYFYFNPNPKNLLVGDCVIRALSVAMDKTWENTYAELTLLGLEMADMPSSNRVWGEYLKEKGWHRHIVPDDCPSCYTVKDFCGEYFRGTYILGTGSHVIAVKDGDYYDTWDSGDEYPVYYWTKGE